MIFIKEYKIKLEEKEVAFFENVAKSLGVPIEKLLEDTLKRSIEIMKMTLNVNYDF